MIRRTTQTDQSPHPLDLETASLPELTAGLLLCSATLASVTEEVADPTAVAGIARTLAPMLRQMAEALAHRTKVTIPLQTLADVRPHADR